MAATQKVNITAEKIEKGFKAQTVFMIIKFDGSEKEYSYVRKYEEDKEGNTVLIYAAKEGNLKLVRYFIAHGSDINHTNHKNQIRRIYYIQLCHIFLIL